ncbi:MAG: hypothetical protein RL033_2513 [Pseudomonadota bacterium]
MSARRPSAQALPLHALLSSIVAASLAGCSGQVRETPPGDTDDDLHPRQPDVARIEIPTVQSPTTTEAVTPPVEPPPRSPAVLHCNGNLASRVQGLNAAYGYDSLAYYNGSTDHARTPPDFALVELAGAPCATSADAAACTAEVEHARAQSASWWHYDDFFSSSWTLLLATSVRGPRPEALNRVVEEWFTQPGRGAYVSRPLSSTGGAPAPTEALAAPPPDAGAPLTDAGGTSADAGPAEPLPGTAAGLPVVTIDYLDELTEFLGSIDTPNEAALIMFANGRPIECAMEREGQDYVASGTWQVSDCPVTSQKYELRVTPEGTFTQVAIGKPIDGGGCVGRRPDGLCAAEAAEANDASGAWLADTAHLEAAAVLAFSLLEWELAALDAPTELLQRLRRAAKEELIHAERVGHLARARGATPAPVVVRGRAQRSVLEIALENAVEGCVRECWGALCAHYQAQTAAAADVRAVWRDIAGDETEHAQLSRDVAHWLEARLTADERAQVAAARAGAIFALRRELDTDISPALVRELGLPGRELALTQFDALTAQVLASA